MFFRKDGLERLLRFDTIRFMKLLEICQYGVITIIISFFIGEWLNNTLPTFNISINNSLFYMLFITCIYFSFYVCFSYYLTKVIYVIPFIFQFINKRYISNKKSEAIIGISIGLTVMLLTTQEKLNNVLKLLHNKYNQ